MKQLYKSLLVILCVIYSFSVHAQETLLPKGLTEQEKILLPNYQFKSFGTSEAPELPVRTAAEWEEVEYVVLGCPAMPTAIQVQIIEAAIQECNVLIATTNVSGVQNFLIAQGIDMTRIEFINAPVNSIWIRDYAGNTVYTNDVGERALVDWIYNRPRPYDDVLPTAHADYLDIPIYITNTGTDDLVNTGGNFMSDGLGNAFASKLVLIENEQGNPYNVSPKTEEQIDGIMQNYMGIDNYMKMEVLPYDAIHHIDMHMKLLDEETLLVSSYPLGVADGPQINENIAYILSHFQTPFGNDYEVLWIPAPPAIDGSYPDEGSFYRTFTNSVFINKTVLVPLYRPEVDDAALALYQELLPGYNIVGINVENMIAGNGAIHCITHTIGVAEPLWIVHEKIREADNYANIPVEAMIKHISGISEAKVFWREKGTLPFQENNMTYISDDNWTAHLSVPSTATEIEYYIWAEANSEKTMTRPIVAPQGYWTFAVNHLGVQDLEDYQILGPYPNPAGDVVAFDVKNISEDITVSIHALTGQKLFENQLPVTNGKISLKLIPTWKGTLIISLSGSFGKINRKLLKL
ncbi:MAG: agmatine deiminase family protein [Weeksellaceae bacterium]